MQNPITQLEQLTLNSKSKAFLREIARWCFFFAILGFLSILFLFVLGILIGTIYAPILDTTSQQQNLPFNLSLPLAITYVFSALISVFPVLYLYQFSKKMKVALATKNDDLLADAFENLKSHFKFIGVMTIISISLYLLLFVFSVFAGSLV